MNLQSLIFKHAPFFEILEKAKPLLILIKDYLIHEFTVHYWKQMTEEFERNKIMIQDSISRMNSYKT